MPSDEVKALYAGAANYADAALLIHDNSKSVGRDGLVLPTHTLIGLAVELAFKAIFIDQGGDPNKLKAVGVRHNLKQLRALILAQGFASTLPQLDEIVDHIGDNYAAHEYRYMKPNSILNKIDVGVAVSVLQTFIDEVASEVGLPKRPSVEP